MTSSATSSQSSLNSFLYTNPTVIVPSSALQPHTIPIYSLKQAATFSSTSTSTSSTNIETQNSKLLLTTTTAAVAATTPTTNHSASNSHQSNDSEWTNSLFRPASRFALKRRECKSTSDESFTFEVSGASHVNTNGNSNNEFLLTSISSLNSGKFGFNPTSRRLSSLTGIITPSNLAASSASNSGAGVFKKNNSFSNGAESTTSKLASMKNQREKKNVKRLSAGNKFFIEHHSKKSQEKKDCK